MFHSAFPPTRRLNSMPLRWTLIIILCISLIYAYNSILHRQCHQSNDPIRNSNNTNRQPHNTAQSKVVEGFSTVATNTSTNTTVDIEDIVNAERQRIATELKDFNFTEQMVGLSALTPETNGQPLQSGKLIHISILWFKASYTK